MKISPFLPLAILAAAPVYAQTQPSRYHISFDNAVHHEARVEVTFPDLSADTLEVVMSRSSPGRYAVHDFGKNVYAVSAVDGSGAALEVTRGTPHSWLIVGHDGAITFRYTLFADHADGTYTGIDATHAHMNMPATFAFAPALVDRSVEVTFDVPDGSGWSVATQLMPTDDPSTFTAPDLHYFMDSPTEVSDFELREWPVESGGDEYTIRLVLHHDGTAAEADDYADMVARVVDEEAAIFGELPDFDQGVYTFLADYLPHVFGDGMEHRNSTILTSQRPLSTGALRNLGTVAHEFFHAWNMERIRSAAIEPFDFERANMSTELWFGEGFTSYYDDLVLHRAGFIGIEEYLDRLEGGLNAVIHSPARNFYGPAGMSVRAPFVDAATSVDATNWSNTFISYYTYGSVLALGLDLMLRNGYGVTLDDYMRNVWDAHGEPGIPYTAADLERLLSQTAGDADFAAGFFRLSVNGSELPAFGELLSHAGLLLRQANTGAAVLGDARITFEDSLATVAAPARIGRPLYEAGVDRGDRILELDGRAIERAEDINAVLDAHEPGDVVAIVFEQRGRRRTTQLTLAADDRFELVTYEAAGLELTPGMRELREDWLGSHVMAARSR